MTFPENIVSKFRNKKIQLFVGSTGPLENVEIYFSKIEQQIFEGDTILLQNPFI